MKTTTILSIGVLAISSAALAQVSTGHRGHHKMSNAMMDNSTMGNSDMSTMPGNAMNSMPPSDGTMMNNMSAPDEGTANSAEPDGLQPAGSSTPSDQRR